MTLVFPDSFKKRRHPVLPGATQWTFDNKDGDRIISIVGGGQWLHGDGVRTFEMYDYRDGDLYEHLLVEEINQHLAENPLD